MIVPPELLERIALFLPTAAIMELFLKAFPLQSLTHPLQSLLAFFHDKHQIDENMLWPVLIAHDHPLMTEFINNYYNTIAVLYQTVQVNYLPFPCTIPSSNLIELVPTIECSDDLLHLTSLNWHHISRFSASLYENEAKDIAWTDDGVNQLCKAIGTMNKLRLFKFTWGCSGKPKWFSQMIKAISVSTIVDFVLQIEEGCDEWSTELLELFKSWVLKKSTKDVAFFGSVGNLQTVQYLAKAIWSSTTLQYIGMFDSNLVSEYFSHRKKIPDSVRAIGAVYCTSEDIENIRHCIGSSYLEALRISFDDAIDSSRHISSAIASLLNLKSLVLCSIAMPTVWHYGPLLTILPQLTDLHLSGNNLKSCGVLEISRILPACKKLKSLRLGSQNCSNSGAMALALALPHCPSLKTLDLSMNQIGLNGVLALTRVIHQLTELDLSYNDIQESGAIGISRVIPRTTRMECLNLGGNLLGKQGVLAIIAGILQTPHRIGYIDLSLTVDDIDESIECTQAVAQLPHPWMIAHSDGDYF
ncbi:hypothetical protein THRCLA_21244 [Thraustotheca clavata]|uniref:RNI-like protein n=1 Tax=Thraustotheca clavata TaxID=74557 RepID=A0A1V9ZYH4_9STRA|nr:hypothetical protein THRCLA_21244 [Thraustotheca clavata]